MPPPPPPLLLLLLLLLWLLLLLQFIAAVVQLLQLSIVCERSELMHLRGRGGRQRELHLLPTALAAHCTSSFTHAHTHLMRHFVQARLIISLWQIQCHRGF